MPAWWMPSPAAVGSSRGAAAVQQWQQSMTKQEGRGSIGRRPAGTYPTLSNTHQRTCIEQLPYFFVARLLHVLLQVGVGLQQTAGTGHMRGGRQAHVEGARLCALGPSP